MAPLFLHVERRRKGDCLLGDGIVKRDDGIEVVLANGATAILLLKEHKNTKRLRQNRSLFVNMILMCIRAFGLMPQRERRGSRALPVRRPVPEQQQSPRELRQELPLPERREPQREHRERR